MVYKKNAFLANTAKTMLTLFAFLFVFSACNRDDLGAKIADKEETLKEITVKVSSAMEIKQSKLRSIEGPEEKTIESINVLAFRVDENDGKEYYDYSVEAIISSQGSKTSLKMVVWTKPYKQRFVLIANAKTEIEALLNSDTWKGTEKDAMLNSLKYTSAQWNATSPTDYAKLPMWGESTQELVTSETSGLVGTIWLLRMLAKIDVQLDNDKVDNDGLGNKFKLKSVRLYNTNTKGCIVPASGNVVSTTQNGNTHISVSKPTIPSDAVIQQGPLVYTDFSSPGEPDIAMKGAIYTFETSADGITDRANATCLVVGGIYNNEGKETYYRIDFLKSDKKTFRDILRNHQYVVNITDVKMSGYDRPEEAFDGNSVNMEVDVIEWDDDGMNNVAFNNQYYLSVSQNNFEFAKEKCDVESSDNVLYVLTDYDSAADQGWKIDNIGKDGKIDGWLSVSEIEGDANVKAKLILTYEDWTGPDSRTAKIVFTAGRLSYTVTVTQYYEQAATIEFLEYQGGALGSLLSSDTLIYGTDKTNEAVLNQHFFVKWTPKGVDLKIMEERINSSTPYFDFGSRPSFGLYMGGGIAPNPNDYSYKDFTLEIPPLADADVTVYPFYTRGVNVVFSVQNGFSETVRTLTLLRVFYNRITDVLSDATFPLDGTPQRFTIKSNTEWAVGNISDPDGILQDVNTIKQQKGGYNTTTGDPFYFSLVDDDSKAGKKAIITLTDPKGKKGDTTVTITARAKP